MQKAVRSSQMGSKADKLAAIIAALPHAHPVTIDRIHTALGLGPRHQSPDVGKPYERTDE